MRPSTTIAFDCAAFVADRKTRIASARLTAARAVNSELVGLYWDIGAAIREKQSAQGWGDGVVERLASDLRRAFPGTTGFSTPRWLPGWRSSPSRRTGCAASLSAPPPGSS